MTDQQITYNEFIIRHHHDAMKTLASLTKEERVLVYYLRQAALVGRRIYADQMHRHNLKIIDLFNFLWSAGNIRPARVTLESVTELDAFYKDVETYFAYLIVNNGIYLIWENFRNKRTPKKLGLTHLTPDSLRGVLRGLPEEKKNLEVLTEIESTIFDDEVDHTAVVERSIAKSGVNIYAPGFTDEDFKNLSPADQTKLNAYFKKTLVTLPEKVETWSPFEIAGSRITDFDGKWLDERSHTPKTEVKLVPYSAAPGDKYERELRQACFWLQKAQEHASKFPALFDIHLITSLGLLIKFYELGDEGLFKLHCIEWLKSSSRIDYCHGFIESYNDPMGYRGFFQAEVTVQMESEQLKKLNKLIPSLEERLPFPPEFRGDGKVSSETKRTSSNASINTKIYGSGALGPGFRTAAYCLPNYEEIRTTHGSKQIIYPSTKNVGQLLAKEKYFALFKSPEEREWIAKFDPENNLDDDLWNFACILHETIGHGSGKFATHTFREGDQLLIAGKLYAVGDVINVTSENERELIGPYSHAMEEMRAEIIAMYLATHHLDELLALGFLGEPSVCTSCLTPSPSLSPEMEGKDGSKKVGVSRSSRPLLLKQIVTHAAAKGLRRLAQLTDDAKEVRGAHALANCTITNYLVRGGAVEIVGGTHGDSIRLTPPSSSLSSFSLLLSSSSLSSKEGEEVKHEVQTMGSPMYVRVKNVDLAIKLIKELAIIVQTIKSTGDGQEAKRLIETYGKPIHNMEQFMLLKKNLNLVRGNIKGFAHIYPHLEPVGGGGDDYISDCSFTLPKDIFESYRLECGVYSRL